MNARASTSNPPPKFTKSFVTPSDSLRSQSFASSPVRTPRDGVPPTKRRRLASTPTSSSLPPSTPRSSSFRPEQPPVSDLHDARMASSMRVFNIWSALAERYNRRLDEDDIVDIRTGEVIKDRGILHELPKRYNFGDLADKDDPTINTDPGSEVADNLADDEEVDEEEGECDAEETDAFPSSDGLVAPQITRLAPPRPVTSSSDADDLGEFLKAEAIRRELDGGDDSSEDEFSILPPHLTPAKRMTTPVKKTPLASRAKSRPLKAPAPDTESEDEFAVPDSDRNGFYRRYRARRAPSPEVPASIPSPPPPSSSPGPSTSISLSSPPLLSRPSLSSNGGPQIESRLDSPAPKRQPLASSSRRTLEDSLNEIDLEFPPPQPRAPSVFARRPDSAIIIDLSLSDDGTEDEQSHPTVKATTDPKPLALESRTVKNNGSILTSKRPVPFVLIETKRPIPGTSAVIASKSTSNPIVSDSVTPPKKGKPRAKSLKDKPPDFGGSQNSKRGEGRKTRLVKEKFQEGGKDFQLSGSPALKVDEMAIIGEATKKVKSPSLSPARSDFSPKAKTRLKPKGKRSPTRLAPSDDEHSLGFEAPPTRRMVSPKSSPGPQTRVMTHKSDSKPKSTRKSATKPKSVRSTRSTESSASTVTATVKSKAPRKWPEVFVDVDVEGDNDSSSPSLPSPSPVPSTRPRIRGALKRKRRISSGPSSGEEQGSPKGNPKQQTSPPDSSGIRTCTTRTPKVTDGEECGHSDDPEAGGSKPRRPSQSLSRVLTEVVPTPAPANATSVMTPSSDGRREDDTHNRLGGSYTHFPAPPPLPMGFTSQTHQSFTPNSGYPPHFQAHAASFNHAPYLNRDHNQYMHGSYPLLQDANTQALLAQAVTQLAVLMNGSRPPPPMGHMGGMAGNMAAMNGFPSSPGWGMFPAWSPSTPITSRHPYGHDHQNRSFTSPYVAHNHMGGGVGSSMPPSTLFPQSGTFPSSLSVPKPISVVQETGAVQERSTNSARSRSRSKRRVAFVLDPRSGSGGGASDPVETPKRETDDSPPMTRGRSQRKGVEKGAPRPQSDGKGKTKAGEADQGPELDVGDSGNEGSVDRHLSPKSRSEVRGLRRVRGRR